MTSPRTTCRKILGGNAGRFYGFDLDALAPIAAKIGPTVAEVHTPLEDTGYLAPPRSPIGRSKAGWR